MVVFTGVVSLIVSLTGEPVNCVAMSLVTWIFTVSLFSLGVGTKLSDATTVICTKIRSLVVLGFNATLTAQHKNFYLNPLPHNAAF